MKKYRIFSAQNEKECCCLIVVSAVLVLFFMLTIMSWQESRENKDYTAKLETRLNEYEQIIEELEKDLSDSKRDMENIVRCVITGEWEKDVRNE